MDYLRPVITTILLFLVSTCISSASAACDNVFSEENIRDFVVIQKKFNLAEEVLNKSIECKDNALARYYLAGIYYLKGNPSDVLNSLLDDYVASALNDGHKRQNARTMTKWAKKEIESAKPKETSVDELANCLTTNCDKRFTIESSYRGELSTKTGMTPKDLAKVDAIHQNYVPVLSEADIFDKR